ncbi:MAG: DoxX family protein [Haliea sp.]|uniref:HvfX family Cu-binding RiPP maturation protein n=1 Tax=Haliea sp. TaxID=1932666 RepID=UPI0032EAA922
MNATLLLARSRDFLDRSRGIDFLAPLLLRLFLAPVFFSAGLTKMMAFESTVSWFGNPEWGLGLPFPWSMAFLATSTELIGGLLLLFGLATRLIAIPLMVTMLVAICTVHWQDGWFAIAPSDPSTSMATPLAAVGFPGAEASLANSEEVGNRLTAARGLLREHGNYNWLTEKGSLVVLNNGIEFGATYFIMLLALFFSGAGRFVSLDYWIGRWLDRTPPLTREALLSLEPA